MHAHDGGVHLCLPEQHWIYPLSNHQLAQLESNENLELIQVLLTGEILYLPKLTDI